MTSDSVSSAMQCPSDIHDWDNVIELADRNKMAPLVLPVVRELAEGGKLASEVLDNMRDTARANIATTMLLRFALGRVLGALNETGTDVMVLKGPVLTALVYDDPNSRPCGDIDLFCRESDFGTVHNCLTSLGYVTEAPVTLPPRVSEKETYFERHFVDPKSNVHIELHVDAMKLGVRPVDVESIWNRAIRVEIDGKPTLALGIEDQIVSLSVHLHRHGFTRLIWFKDIDLIIRKYSEQIDWNVIVNLANSEGAGSSLWYTFKYLKKMLDTPIDEGVVRRLQPSLMMRQIYNRVWPESDIVNLDNHTKRRAVQFSVLESWRGMIPSLFLMGRRREKMGIMLKRKLPI